MATIQQVTSTVCPVCTLFLRPGISLKQHLATHPKQKIIEALAKLSPDEPSKSNDTTQSQNDYPEVVHQNHNQVPQIAPYMNQLVGAPSNMNGLPSNLSGNHFFMYQQSMSTSSPHQPSVSAMPFNPFGQQYLVPAIYNPQMMPYFYQQQQVIMSSNGMPPPHVKALPFDSVGQQETSSGSAINRISDISINDDDKEKGGDKDNVRDDDKDEVQPQNLSNPSDSERIKETVPDDQIASSSQKAQVEELLINYEDPLSAEESGDDESESVYKSEVEPDRPDSAYSYHENLSEQNYSAHCDEEQNTHDTHDSRYLRNNLIDHEECVDAATSQASIGGWTFNQDLNKACQTQNSANLSPRPVSNHEEGDVRVDFFFVDQRSNVSNIYTPEEHTPYEQSELIYTSANIINNTEGIEYNLTRDVDIEAMQVIIGDFSNSSVVQPPPESQYDNTREENAPILMTIAGMPIVPSKPQPHQSVPKVEILDYKILGNSMEENCVDNVNIRSDEKMPARGELSGQESMGSSSDMTWNQIQHYQEQDGVGCYEHNSWDSNSVGMHSSYMEENEKKDVSTVNLAALKEELKEGVSSTQTQSDSNATDKTNICPRPLALDINKRRVKKLIIKPKRSRKETQVTNFDNVFTSRLKVENNEEDIDDPGIPEIDIALGSEDNKNGIKEEDRKLLIINMCKICDQFFKTKKELRMHNKEFHNQQKIKTTKCQVCDEVFDIEHKFKEHLKIHPLECRMCGKLFYRRQGLKLHINRHLGIKPFKCDLCDKAFLVKQKLEEHRNCHTGNSPIKCSMCNETFKRYSNLVQHRNKHHFMIKRKIKDYICSCGEVFHTKKKLAWHKEIHDPKPKACTQCSEKFIHMASLTRHIRKAHNATYLPEDRNQELNTECPVCKGVYLKSSLDAHLKTHTSQKPFHCSICNKNFTTKWNLKLHKWTHSSRTQKPFKCEQCKGAFIRENDYISHMNSHKSLRPYTCNYCGARFIRKYNCLRHVKEHENEKTYNCNLCGKSFHRSYYLKDHMRVHSGVRPYSCHICGKRSTTKSNHNKHVEIHHAREPVSTEN
ncbi:uncharacterized protein LOC126734718 [Anthonomus grandis grandis]|uniref:uncharacterized protein LOC126734718 n=1 Tax=Anthonomus grandis grandis TaxID=2921223 RepID=UPI00216637F7|nr:uncharacterized protein LOC126734718 [Anthonomus grandis grandis]